MNINVIGSGSSGNCIIYEDKIMLDCGLSYSKIKQYLKNINIIFISHVHTDHCLPSTIKKIAFEYPTIKFIVGFQNVDKLIEIGVNKKNIFALDLEKWYQIGKYKIRLDYLIHDVPNYSIKIKTEDNKKIIYIVDTSSVKHLEAKNYDYALIEANYLTNEELDNEIKKAKEEGKFTHLERVRETHLSQLDAFNWLQENNIDNYTFIHQHKEKRKEND